jgi:hypothetical protein
MRFSQDRPRNCKQVERTPDGSKTNSSPRNERSPSFAARRVRLADKGTREPSLNRRFALRPAINHGSSIGKSEPGWRGYWLPHGAKTMARMVAQRTARRTARGSTRTPGTATISSRKVLSSRCISRRPFLWVEEAIVAITELPPSRQGVASSHGLILAASAQRHHPRNGLRRPASARPHARAVIDVGPERTTLLRASRSAVTL